MTARLALTRANVQLPSGGVLEKVTVMSRTGRLVVSRSTGAELLNVEATAVRVVGRGFEVDTPEGVYKITRAKGG